MKRFKIVVSCDENTIFKKIQEAASKKEAWRMSEGEIKRSINELFRDAGNYRVSVTLKEARKIGGFPKKLIGV